MPYKKYAVVSGEMWDIIPVLEDGSGPKEYYKDYAEVAARDKIEAIVKAVRGKKFAAWRRWQKDNDESPYSGVEAEEI